MVHKNGTKVLYINEATEFSTANHSNQINILKAKLLGEYHNAIQNASFDSFQVKIG